MKSSIIRTVDEFGRISLPKGMRDILGISERDSVQVELNGDMITVSKLAKSCVFCGNNVELVEFMGKVVCDICARNLGECLGVANS